MVFAAMIQHIEAQFNLRGMTVDETKCYHEVTALYSSTIHRVMGLLGDLPASGKYDAFKQQLLATSSCPMQRGLSTFCPSMAWETVSQLNMLALLSLGDASFLFVQLFLWQLLPLVHTALASSPLVRTKDYTGLAEEADRILLASYSVQYSVHALFHSEPSSLLEESVVTAMTAHRSDSKEQSFYYHRFS